MKEFKVGERATTRRVFTEQAVNEYAALTGAKPDRRFVPGPLVGGMFSLLLGTQLPGRGTNYLKQRLEFPAPARVGEELVATVEVVRVRPEKELVNLRTTCTNAAGDIICTGEALVLVRDVA